MSGLPIGEALAAALRARERGEGAALVNVVANRSDLPLSNVDRLVVFERSPRAGSLSPRIDDEAERLARRCLAERRSRLRAFTLTGEGIEEVGAQGGDIEVFVEVLTRPPRLVIAGAGHIAVPLARFATSLGFDVAVLDDRPEYASRERFPDAQQVVVAPFRESIHQVSIDADTYVVLVTRGHVHDRALLEECLGSGAAYIGMIGSRRRVETVLRHLRGAGADPEGLARVWAPIGLDIGAQTPEEIALSVMAEIVKVRRGGTGRSLAIGLSHDD